MKRGRNQVRDINKVKENKNKDEYHRQPIEIYRCFKGKTGKLP
jgi:hypothetical protein